jgi:hypothetical protein
MILLGPANHRNACAGRNGPHLIRRLAGKAIHEMYHAVWSELPGKSRKINEAARIGFGGIGPTKNKAGFLGVAVVSMADDL